MERVEPAAGLIHGLRNEIRRKRVIKRGLLLERIMPLRERHGAGVEPHVDEFGNPLHVAAAPAFQNDVVDVGLVQIKRLRQFGAFAAKFLDAAHGATGIA